MKLVIEVPDDFEDDNALKIYLRRMQDESDLAAQESPEDFWPGWGTMDIGTAHMRSDAKIIGSLYLDNEKTIGERYRIEPLPEV